MVIYIFKPNENLVTICQKINNDQVICKTYEKVDKYEFQLKTEKILNVSEMKSLLDELKLEEI